MELFYLCNSNSIFPPVIFDQHRLRFQLAQELCPEHDAHLPRYVVQLLMQRLM